MFFQTYTNNISEGDQERKLPHSARSFNNKTLFKNTPPSIATDLGNLDQECNNIQLTKQFKYKLEVEENKVFYPDIEIVNTHELCSTITPLNIKRKGFIDLTGVFPHKSIQGNLYVMVMYDYYSNSILSQPIKIVRQNPPRIIF